MAHRLKKITIPEPPGYGAAELKLDINANTSKAFLIMLLFTMFLFLTKLAVGSDSEDADRAFHYPKISAYWLEVDIDGASPEEDFKLAPPEVPDIDMEGLKDEIFGKIVAAPGATIDTDDPIFVTIDKINEATGQTGDGVFEKPISLSDIEKKPVVADIPVDKVNKDVDVGPGVYQHVDIKAVVDLAELQSLIVYPQIAIEAGIEGKVTVQFRIDEEGYTSDVRILKTVSEILNQAAKEAVLKLKCVAAIKEGKAVACWVVVPINFVLNKR